MLSASSPSEGVLPTASQPLQPFKREAQTVTCWVSCLSKASFKSGRIIWYHDGLHHNDSIRSVKQDNLARSSQEPSFQAHCS